MAFSSHYSTSDTERRKLHLSKSGLKKSYHKNEDDEENGEDIIRMLLSSLEEIWNHVESKKEEMEIICRESRKLLKPLPNRSHENRLSESSKIPSEDKKGHKDKSSEVESPSENELAELDLIQKALEKARKTWKKHRQDSEDLVQIQTKSGIESNPKNPGISEVVSEEKPEVGVISQKELTKALSNVRVSRIKAAYKKAPYKTNNCERKKNTISTQTYKSQPKSSSSSSHLKNSKNFKDGNSASCGKSIPPKDPNFSKDIKIHSNVTSSDSINSPGSLQGRSVCENKRNNKTEWDSGVDSNMKSSPLYVVPTSIKQLFQQNHSLKRRIGKTKEHPPKNAESFFNLWESKMTKNPNDEAKLLTQKYENLFVLLQSLNLPYITDSSSPQEILEAKISLEYILTSMYDLNQQTEILLKKAETRSTGAVLHEMEPVLGQKEPALGQKEPAPKIVPKEIWLPPDLLKSPFYENLRESSLRKGLHYSRVQELNEYWDEQHKLQEILLSQHFITILQEAFLPLLKSNNLQQRERIFLYRIFQGFLHHKGKHFPTLIDS